MNREQALAAVGGRHRVVFVYASDGGVHARGEAIAYSDGPQLLIETDTGERIIYHEIQDTPANLMALIPGLDPVIASPVTMQGDTPPAPFPAEVLAWGARLT